MLHSGFLLDNRRWLGDLLAEDVSLDKVWEPNSELIRDELLCGNRKDLCKKRQYQDMKERLVLLTIYFLQSKLLGLSDEAKDHEPSD